MKKVKFPFDYNSVSLQNVKGSATFIGKPSNELLQAVNKLAEIVSKKFVDSKCPKHGVAYDYINGNPVCPVCE